MRVQVEVGFVQSCPDCRAIVGELAQSCIGDPTVSGFRLVPGRRHAHDVADGPQALPGLTDAPTGQPGGHFDHKHTAETGLFAGVPGAAKFDERFLPENTAEEIAQTAQEMLAISDTNGHAPSQVEETMWRAMTDVPNGFD